MFELPEIEVPTGMIGLSPAFRNGGGSIVMDRAKFDAIPVYRPVIAAPAAPIAFGVLVPAGVYHSITTAGRVAIAKYDEVKITWIKTEQQKQLDLEFNAALNRDMREYVKVRVR